MGAVEILKVELAKLMADGMSEEDALIEIFSDRGGFWIIDFEILLI